MQPLNSKRSDPAPSRMSYRVQRMMLTPMYRRMLRVGVPFVLCFGVAATYLSKPDVQQSIWFTIADMREQVETRPEFMVKLLAVEGASNAIAEDIRDSFPYVLPASSFDMELDDVRLAVEEIPAVQSAAVRLRQGGVLEVQVTERVPVALMRTRQGLQVIDLEGVVIDMAPSRAARPGLPVLTGEGARSHVPEALAIKQAAGPLHLRMRGLVRMGERRWDVVLDRDQRILLPEQNPVRALERVIVLNQSQEMLDRDIAAVDMRIAARPTLRMKTRAVEGWWRVRNMGVGTGDQ